MRRGCVVTIIVALGLLAPFFWPYRLDTIASVVARNDTGCVLDVTDNSGWKSRAILPGIDAEEVVYPLEANIFVEGCPGVNGGRPYAAELVSATTGKVLAQGRACAGAREEDFPCRIPSLAVVAPADGQRFIVRVQSLGDTAFISYPHTASSPLLYPQLISQPPDTKRIPHDRKSSRCGRSCALAGRSGHAADRFLRAKSR